MAGTKKDEKKAAEAFGKRAASKGGRARASVLSPEERSEIAKAAARARWAKAGNDVQEVEEEHDFLAALSRPVVATSDKPYSKFRGVLGIGDVELQCHVLNDGRRVLTQREVVRALSGGRVSGSYQENIARAADLIVRACARVGIEALIDEATGYQEVRAKNALQIKRQLFIAEQMGDWVRRFPDEFWIQLARLEGVKYSGQKRPWRWGNMSCGLFTKPSTRT
jgi:hypothetical protein